MSERRELFESGVAFGVAQERERIAKWLELHSVDWDCSILVHDEDEYVEEYCERGPSGVEEFDEFKADACRRRTLADRVRKGS